VPNAAPIHNQITLPEPIEFTDDARKMAAEALNICRRRMEAMT
jgi:hypothetical protein